MDCSMIRFPVLHYLPDFAQTHVHWVNDAIQQSYALLPTSPPAFSIHRHQSLCQWVGPLHQMAKVLRFSFSISTSNEYSGWFPLELTGLISLLSKGPSKDFSSTTLWKHQFFGAQPSLWSNTHICTWLLEKPELWLCGPLSTKWWLCF